MFGDVSLEPEQTLVHVDCDVPFADETQDEVVGEPGVAGLNLAEGGPERLGRGNVAMFQLKRKRTQ